MSSFLIFAVSNAFWTSGPRNTPPDANELLREQLCELRSLRGRIAGGVNLESERSRFSAAISRVENELLHRLAEEGVVRAEWDAASLRETLQAGRMPVMELGEGYLHLLVAVELAREERRTPGINEPADPLALGASVFESSDLTNHLDS
jgi:hypothetical protein